MTWDYRVIVTSGERASLAEVRAEEYEEWAIHEVYYDDEGKPDSYTENPSSPEGETEEELLRDAVAYMAALAKPVLTPEDFE